MIKIFTCVSCCGVIYIVLGVIFFTVGVSLDAITAYVTHSYFYEDAVEAKSKQKRSISDFPEYLVGAQGKIRLHYFTLPENVEVDFTKGNLAQNVVNNIDDCPTASFQEQTDFIFTQKAPLEMIFTFRQESVMIQKISDLSVEYRNMDIFNLVVQKHIVEFCDEFFEILTSDSSFSIMIDIVKENLQKTLMQSIGKAFGTTTLRTSAQMLTNFLSSAKSEIETDLKTLENVKQILDFIVYSNSLLIDSYGNLTTSNQSLEIQSVPIYTSISSLGIAPDQYTLPGYPGIHFVQNETEDVRPNYGTVSYKSVEFWWDLSWKYSQSKMSLIEDFLKRYDLFVTRPFWTDSQQTHDHQGKQFQRVEPLRQTNNYINDYFSTIIDGIWNVVSYDDEPDDDGDTGKPAKSSSTQKLGNKHENDSHVNYQNLSNFQEIDQNGIMSQEKFIIPNDNTAQSAGTKHQIPPSNASKTSEAPQSRTIKLNVLNMTKCPEMSQDPPSAPISIVSPSPDPTRILLLPVFNLPVNGTIALQINIRIPRHDNYGALQGQALPLLWVDLMLLRLPPKVSTVLEEALALRAGLVVGLPIVGVTLCLIGIGVMLSGGKQAV